ncbi:MAG: GNAT family N-acetyltransferase [Vicinamibacterales bacterium]
MDLVRSNDLEPREYERFLDGFASGPGVALAYHYPFYLAFLAGTAYPGSETRFVAARGADGALAGVFPALHVRTARLAVSFSLPYFGPNGGAIVRDAGPEGAALVARLVAAACDDARDRGCGSMTILTPLGADGVPYAEGLGGADFEVARVAQTLALPPAGEASPWPRKVRYDVRRAAALGVTVREMAGEAELDAVWEIYRETAADAGIPLKPREHLRALYREAGARGVFLVAERDQEVVAGLVAFMGGGVLSYYLPCTRPDARPLQPGLLLLDRAAAIARAAGCRLLNFEASPGEDGPVYRFKARCGGQPVPYRVLVKLLRPGVLDDYRALAPAGVAAEAPHAFVIPFDALTRAQDGAR